MTNLRITKRFDWVFGVDTLQDVDGAVGWGFGFYWLILGENVLFFVKTQG